MSPFLVLPRALSKPLRWPIDSARQARHNAFAAAAALAVRRAEREDVDRFLLEHSVTGRDAAAPQATEPVLPDPVTTEAVESAISVPGQRTESTPEPTTLAR